MVRIDVDPSYSLGIYVFNSDWSQNDRAMLKWHLYSYQYVHDIDVYTFLCVGGLTLSAHVMLCHSENELYRHPITADKRTELRGQNKV